MEKFRGMTLVYLMVSMVAATALASLAVDFGRVELAKVELERAADAAARYASIGASDGTAVAKAIAAAADNKVDSAPLVLQSSDVQLITWNNGTYTIGGSAPNGVVISAKRTAARGTAIPLLFAKTIGITSCDVNATSVAVYQSGLPPFGFVGINGTLLQNNTITVDSYIEGSASVLNHGYIATNKDVTLTGGVTIQQDIYMLAGRLNTNGSPSYGTRQTLSTSLVYPTISSAPVGSTSLGNVNNGTTLGSGTTNTNYSCTSLSINTGQTLNINGPVTIYLTGNCTLNGTVRVVNNLPSNFSIRMMNNSGVNIQTTTLYADIYAPQSAINLNNTANFYGRLIGDQLSVNGSCAMHYDESLPDLPGATQAPPASTGSSSASISLVKQ